MIRKAAERTLIASDLFPAGGFLRDNESACNFDFFSRRESTSFSLEAISFEIWSSDATAPSSFSSLVVFMMAFNLKVAVG